MLLHRIYLLSAFLISTCAFALAQTTPRRVVTSTGKANTRGKEKAWEKRRNYQFFTLKSGTQTLTGKEGTKLTLRTEDLYRSDGTKPKLPITLKLGEYYSLGSALVAGLSTETVADSLLSTAGMVEFRALDADGQELALREGATMDLEMANLPLKDTSYKYFYGRGDFAHHSVKWYDAEESKQVQVRHSDTLGRDRIPFGTVLIAEQQPIPGYDFQSYLKNNLVFPPSAKKAKKSGVAYVNFTVKADGSISNVSAQSMVDTSFAFEAARVIKNMPRWHPGKANGKPIDVGYKVPIRFNSDSSRISNLPLPQLDNRSKKETTLVNKLSVKGFGYVNCDRFMGVAERRYLTLESGSIDIALVFSNEKAILPIGNWVGDVTVSIPLISSGYALWTYLEGQRVEYSLVPFSQKDMRIVPGTFQTLDEAAMERIKREVR